MIVGTYRDSDLEHGPSADRHHRRAAPRDRHRSHRRPGPRRPRHARPGRGERGHRARPVRPGRWRSSSVRSRRATRSSPTRSCATWSSPATSTWRRRRVGHRRDLRPAGHPPERARRGRPPHRPPRRRDPQDADRRRGHRRRVRPRAAGRGHRRPTRTTCSTSWRRSCPPGSSSRSPGDERFRFQHSAARTTLQSELSDGRRRRMHRKVAEALEAALGDDPGDRVGELATHWMAATAPVEAEKATHYARLAGQRAEAALAPDEAVRWFTMALETPRSRRRARRPGAGGAPGGAGHGPEEHRRGRLPGDPAGGVDASPSASATWP